MLIRVHPCVAPPLLPSVPSLNPTRKTHFAPIPQPHLSITHLSIRPPIPTFTPKSRSTKHSNTTTDPLQEPTGDDDDLSFPGDGDDLPFPGDGDDLPFPGAGEGDEDDFSSSPSAYREGEKDYDKDPEFADILGSFFDDPKKGQARLEERIRKKRNKMVHTKTGSAAPMTVIFNNFDFSNSYIWFEFYNVPLPKDVSLICNTIRSWHIVGRLGGCNSMNMQLSQSPLENKRPSYDAIQGANVTPTTFYNIGDLEVQDNLARIWVDIGTSEPLLLDVLINALSNISSDYVGIKQLVFGGKEFKNWRENPTSEDPGFSTHKI